MVKEVEGVEKITIREYKNDKARNIELIDLNLFIRSLGREEL